MYDFVNTFYLSKFKTKTSNMTISQNSGDRKTMTNE